MDERDIVDTIAQVRKELAHVFAALAPLSEPPPRLDDAALILVPASAKRFYIDRFAIHADHLRLIVERVDMARTAIHKEENDTLCLRWQQRRFHSQWIGELRSSRGAPREKPVDRQERRERRGTKT